MGGDKLPDGALKRGRCVRSVLLSMLVYGFGGSFTNTGAAFLCRATRDTRLEQGQRRLFCLKGGKRLWGCESESMGLPIRRFARCVK